MNDHERDLILALTDGSLDDEEAQRAMARVAGDPELAAELSRQRSVAAMLAAVPETPLTADERARLRGALIDQLHLTDAPVRTPAPVHRPSRWWQPVLGVAAVAAVVTAVVILPGGLGGGDELDVATLQETGSSSAVTTTMAVASAPEADAFAGGSAQDEGAEEVPETTEVLAVQDVDGQDLLEATEGETTPEGVTRALGEQAPVPTTEVAVDDIAACLESLASRLPAGETQPIAIDARQDGELLYLTVDPGNGVAAVVTIRLDTCALVDIDQ